MQLLSKGAFSYADDSLTIISPHWDGVKKEFTKKFREWYKKNHRNGVEIEWLDQGGTSDDLRFIKSEFIRTPDGINADLFWGGGLDPYLDLSEKGLLAPYKPP
ncbi:MAG: hypothetical protein HY350_05500, partial [Candidatus Omnitrophica bacterium]|nr:hypothetical protein [Candidatus Omnitrophota bacterium]